MLFSWLKATVYVRLRRDWLVVRDLATGREFQDQPLLALQKQKAGEVILAVGEAALAEQGKEQVQLVNGFAHPRSVLNDFSIAEKTLGYFIRQLFSGSLFRPAPIVILHIMEDFEGGLTQIEIRALLELGAGVGGREVYIWQGQELTDDAISHKHYPEGTWMVGPPKTRL